MDEVTQQNSALVEQNAAAAKALEEQSREMDQRVRFFQLRKNPADSNTDTPGHPASALRSHVAAGAKSVVATAPKRAAPVAATQRRPARRLQAGIAAAFKEEPDIEEF